MTFEIFAIKWQNRYLRGQKWSTRVPFLTSHLVTSKDRHQTERSSFCSTISHFVYKLRLTHVCVQYVMCTSAENEQLRSERQCKVCLDNELNRLLTPCGHPLCSECLGRLENHSCPVCRTSFRNDDVRPIKLCPITIWNWWTTMQWSK